MWSQKTTLGSQMKKKWEARESERPEKASAFPLKFKAIRPCLLNVAERRTPGCRFSTWGMWNRRRCVVTLGSEDLRVYIADHKPPTVFDLNRLHVRRGQRHLELSRSNWTTKVFQRLCCCEPLTCTITMRLDQVRDQRGSAGLFQNRQQILWQFSGKLMEPYGKIRKNHEKNHRVWEFDILKGPERFLSTFLPLRTTDVGHFWSLQPAN